MNKVTFSSISVYNNLFYFQFVGSVHEETEDKKEEEVEEKKEE